MTTAVVQVHTDHALERLAGSSRVVDTRAVYPCFTLADEAVAQKGLDKAFRVLKDWFAKHPHVVTGDFSTEDIQSYFVDAVTTVMYSSITEMGIDFASEQADQILAGSL
jgi:hypothetical protein